MSKLRLDITEQRNRCIERQTYFQKVLSELPDFEVDYLVEGFRIITKIRDFSQNPSLDSVLAILKDLFPAYSYDLTHDLDNGDGTAHNEDLDRMAADSSISNAAFKKILMDGTLPYDNPSTEWSIVDEIGSRMTGSKGEIEFSQVDTNYDDGDLDSGAGIIATLENGQKFEIIVKEMPQKRSKSS